jgi:hypothetical protein
MPGEVEAMSGELAPSFREIGTESPDFDPASSDLGLPRVDLLLSLH